jgi:hypothetical protein
MDTQAAPCDPRLLHRDSHGQAQRRSGWQYSKSADLLNGLHLLAPAPVIVQDALFRLDRRRVKRHVFHAIVYLCPAKDRATAMSEKQLGILTLLVEKQPMTIKI